MSMKRNIITMSESGNIIILDNVAYIWMSEPELVELFGVEMEILTFGRKLTFEEYYSIYEAVLPKKMMDKIRLV